MAKVVFVKHNYLIDELGIGYLSSALKAAGHQTDIIKTKKESIWKKLKEFQPDILAYSVTTGWQGYYTELNQKIKRSYDCWSIFGGPHATFSPEDLIERPGVDAICRGEGERAIVAFANAVDRGSVFSIPNVWTKYQRTERFFDLEPVDSILEPDRELIYKYPENRKNRIKNVLASRGCRFNCSYCYNSAMRKLYPNWRVRRRSPDLIAQEVRRLKEGYPLELVFFQDDVFVNKTEDAEKFSKTYKIEAGVPFHAQLRYDCINNDILKLLKEAGCQSVTFAVESANPRICTGMLHRPANFEKLEHLIDFCKKLGIKVRTECMIGLPTERIENAFQTLDLCTRLQPEIAWCSLYQPYPETKLGQESKKMGLWDGNLAKFEPDFFTRSLLNQPHKKLFENLQKLFSVVVAYPLLKPLIKAIIQLPPNPLFKWIYRTFKKWKYDRLYSTS